METSTIANITRDPGKIDNSFIVDEELGSSQVDTETLLVAEKLMEHLRIIREFEERIKAIDYLSNSAEKLAGNLKFTTNDSGIIAAIANLGGTGNTVDFILFKKAIDVTISSYEQMALVSLTGVKNA